MLSRFQNHIEQKFTFLKDKKLLLAVSGGLDSMALLYLFHKLNYKITVAHCNFQLRGKESDNDEKLVIRETDKLNIPCYTILFGTKSYADEQGISIQMAARELRYAWFKKVMQEQQLDYLLTAHHLDDNLETFLINLSRGTGLHGLTGIPEINKNIIRPLLIFERSEIEQFVISQGVNWREDQSNSDVKYLRNKIRQEVVPSLKGLNSNFLQSFSQTIENLKGSEEIVDQSISKLKEEVITKSNGNLILDIEKLNLLKIPKPYLYELLKDYGFTEWDDIVNLLKAQSGKQLFSKTYCLTKDRKKIILSLSSKTPEDASIISIKENSTLVKLNSYQNPLYIKLETISVGKNYSLPDKRLNKKIAFIDKDLLKFPLTVRKWEKGDYFYPLGMQGKKKLSDFFIDEKLSVIEKKNILLLCSENQIVWLISKRIDNRFKITAKTNNILKIEISS